MGITKLGGGPRDSFSPSYGQSASLQPHTANSDLPAIITSKDLIGVCSIWGLLTHSMIKATAKPAEPAPKRSARGVTWV